MLTKMLTVAGLTVMLSGAAMAQVKQPGIPFPGSPSTQPAPSKPKAVTPAAPPTNAQPAQSRPVTKGGEGKLPDPNLRNPSGKVAR